ncbi:MAG: NAD(P)-dependent oxidoreductase [Salibaculum sp.]|uniref:NAD-dependent epimerase/dehydratase family protein n=1 Tax=Salibaculum sp. TaxID=2855480 RepID=UPI00286FF15B|nr:NAD(P)-dependent oxidoreductase [Salibaculum sp.]MDR9428549.1 NAD(P)-dependent oxidoreductase [Salibaculum sp.]MDR9482974.1 NAD(P)-dependent oxidoreductase [Salibaculum sp.]
MIALTGASGLVGRFLLAALPGPVTVLGRTPLPGHAHRPWDLTGPAPDLTGAQTLVHAAFSHVPGRYRGGEGDDPEGFLRVNLDGTRRLLDAAATAGVARVLFLSSRAVFDGLPDNTPLTEDTAPAPASLYGHAKARAEAHLATLPLIGQSLRATGVYGPGSGHKWQGVFADYLAGRPVAPRGGTELHGADLAAAATLLIGTAETGAFHASDLLLDRHDLLAQVRHLTGCPYAPPARSERPVNPLICRRLPALGWHPGGLARLRADLPAMLRNS